MTIYPQKFRLVVGLGNPGGRYRRTRHNTGFLWLDEWMEQLSLPFSGYTNFCADIASQQDVAFMKPQTFMNLSGEAVGKWVRFYRIPSEQVLVIHDELDLPFNVLRMKFGSGSTSHNGVKNIAAEIGSKFWRLRVGIGRPTTTQQSVTDFVLESFSQSENDSIRKKAHDFFNDYWDNVQKEQLPKVIESLHKST